MSPLNKTGGRVLDVQDNPELVLELPSFAGGENTVGEDQELKVNEARIIENWDAVSLGGMIRSKGFNEVADGGATYTAAPDGLCHHFEGSTIRNFILVGGELAYKNAAVITQQTTSAYTNGTLCGCLSAGGAFWFTNATDNLKRATIAGGSAAATGQPSSARERIYYHKSRLIAEGGGVTVFGSRAGTGNWNSANTFSASGDAWNIDLPDLTKGCAPGFPSGDEVTVFTEFGAYSLFNFPNISFRPVAGSPGCSAPFSIATGQPGVFFFSKYPTRGVFLWDRSNWIELTINEDWVDDVDLTKRCFGIYREGKYHIFYNELGSGVSYPNRWRIYDTAFGRWMTRTVHTGLSDSFAFPAVLYKSSNELYVTSAQKDKVYELETEDNSDEGLNTIANYKTKDFTSKDFGLERDEIRMKLLKVTISYYGSRGLLSFQWNSDRGIHTGSQVIEMTADGAMINSSFTVNTSFLSSPPPTRTITRSFGNNAVGRRFSFQILNSNTGDRPIVKKVKVFAVALEEA